MYSNSAINYLSTTTIIIILITACSNDPTVYSSKESTYKKAQFHSGYITEPFIYAKPDCFNGKNVKQIKETEYSYKSDSSRKERYIKYFNFGIDGYLTNNTEIRRYNDLKVHTFGQNNFEWIGDYQCCIDSDVFLDGKNLKLAKLIASGFKGEAINDELKNKQTKRTCIVLRPDGKILKKTVIESKDTTIQSYSYNDNGTIKSTQFRKKDGTIKKSMKDQFGEYGNTKYQEKDGLFVGIQGETTNAFHKNGLKAYSRNVIDHMENRYNYDYEYNDSGQLLKEIETRVDGKGIAITTYKFINGINERVKLLSIPSGEILDHRPSNGLEHYTEFEYDAYKNWVRKSKGIIVPNKQELLYQTEREIIYY